MPLVNSSSRWFWWRPRREYDRDQIEKGEHEQIKLPDEGQPEKPKMKAVRDGSRPVTDYDMQDYYESYLINRL